MIEYLMPKVFVKLKLKVIAKDGNFFSKTAMDMINKVFPTQDEFRIQAAKIEFDGSDFLQ